MSPTCDQKITKPMTEGVTLFHCFPFLHPPEVCLDPEHKKIKNSLLWLCVRGRNEEFHLSEDTGNPSDWTPSLIQGSPNIPVPHLLRVHHHPPISWTSQDRNVINPQKEKSQGVNPSSNWLCLANTHRYKVFQTGQKFPLFECIDVQI